MKTPYMPCGEDELAKVYVRAHPESTLIIYTGDKELNKDLRDQLIHRYSVFNTDSIVWIQSNEEKDEHYIFKPDGSKRPVSPRDIDRIIESLD